MLEAVKALVREIAQREVTPRFLKVAHSHKSDGSLFTEADLATQQALEAQLPLIRNVPVLGEEMTEQQQHDAWDAGRDGLWCVDPIDGTSNFVAGVPYFAVSVAYLYKGERQLGVIYDPIADEMFSAERGKGAHLNGTPLPLRAPATPLNVSISNQRAFAARTVRLDQIKAIGKHSGTSVNDVVLTICAGALKRYLAEYAKDAETARAQVQKLLAN